MPSGALLRAKEAALAQKEALIDIYDLICWLDGKRDLNHARKVIAEYFDVELANFPKSIRHPEQMEMGLGMKRPTG